MIPVSSFVTPYLMEPLLDMMGLRGCLFYGFWKAIELGGTAQVGYTFLWVMSLSSPCCLMSLSLAIREFLSLVVGSL